jgi:small conductance mechanosensitive channel
VSEGRKEKILWGLSLGGLILATFFLLPSINGTVDAQPPQPLRSPNSHSQYPVPQPKPRETGIVISRPFLFELAGSDKMSGKEREQRLLDRYQELLDTLTSEDNPEVAVDTSVGIATVTIDGKSFATVLPQDCPEYFSRLTEDQKRVLEQEVAYAWANVIQADLYLQVAKRHPVYLQLYHYLSVVFFFLTCMGHLTLNWISRRFARNPLWIVKALLWLVYVTVLTSLNPSLEDLANLLSHGALAPTFYAILCGVAAGLAHQATQIAIHRYSGALAAFEQGASVRASLRRQTLEHAWTFLSQVTWTFLGLCLYLYMLGVDLSSFFAGAGLVGVAIGVVARDVFLDFFNGVYILAEDQFGIGDWIEAGSDSGEVVAFSLRSTKIRRSDGSLATLPNSDLRRVKNHSNEWSMVDFRVTVTYQTNTDFALGLILEEIAFLETEWQDKFAGPPELLGLEELGSDGIQLRVRLKTVPLAQWETRRRLNRRVKLRFDAEGIDFAYPSRTVYLHTVSESPGAQAS